MLIVFFFVLVIVVILYILSFSRYRTFLGEIDINRFKLKKLLPIGLLILDCFKKGYSTYYDRKLLAAVGEIYEQKNNLFWLRMHWANKLVLVVLAILFCTFIGAVSKPDGGYAAFCALLIGCAAYLPDKDLFNKVSKRRLAIQMDFPDFINKLALLINAGMTVQKAWEKAALGSGKDTPLYRELNTAIQDIKAGKPEHRAYEEFAKSCRTPEITRFISVVLQNIRKGNSELVPILRVFSVECWEMRKNTAKRYGEEASTKMLLPMMLMFVAILIIVGVPAILSLQGIA